MSVRDQTLPKLKRGDDLSEDCVGPAGSARLKYDDGNVILQAGGTQFKVHKSILAENSSVFGDMFGFPQPPTVDTDIVEGCPIVHLTDSSEELRVVLEAIYRRRFVQDIPPLSVVSAFLHLGRKYDIQNLYTEAANKIYHDCPITLQARDDSNVRRAIDIGNHPSSWMELAIVARREGLLSALPFILYQCCIAYSATEILNGISHQDGLIIQLPSEDQAACLEGHRSIVGAQARTTYAWLYQREPLSPLCMSSDACIQARQDVLDQDFIPLAGIYALHDWESGYGAGLCVFCARVGEVSHRDGREAFWNELPSLFNLPQWDELFRERQEQYGA